MVMVATLYLNSIEYVPKMILYRFVGLRILCIYYKRLMLGVSRCLSVRTVAS
jgi:hypothetical protein